MENILVINDFSHQAKIGLTFANSVIKKGGGSIVILEIDAGDRKQTTNQKEIFYSEISLVRNFDLTFDQVDEISLEKILEKIKAHNIGLIVQGVSLSQKDGSGLNLEIFDAMTKKPECPPIMLTANINGNVILHDMGVLIPLDDEISEVEIRRIKALNQKLKTKLHLLHVAEPGKRNNIEVIERMENLANEHSMESATFNILQNDDTLDGVKMFTSRKNIDIITVLGQQTRWNTRASEVADKLLNKQYCSLFWIPD